MGVRLYPKTRNRASLETLAGVNPGTYDRLDAVKVQHAEANKGTVEEQAMSLNPYEMEELEAEYNARYDYLQEAYGSSALDPDYEMYCDQVEENDATTFDQWLARNSPTSPYAPEPPQPPQVPVDDDSEPIIADDEIPF